MKVFEKPSPRVRFVTFKALSVKQPWASMIASGSKMIETRKWPTKYRGELIIVASKKPAINNLPTGVTLCITEIVDCQPMTSADEELARCELYDGAYSWFLANTRPIKHIPVKGQLGIYTIDLELP